ncbi:MAG: TetR/AcrR family transcriptional regulator [Bacteroidales bacterium]|jgi:AcrR family transcriptional regulator|nr:TetR/AcrR family transcriptional regulator [Bacteroidales bacterium]
MDYRQRIIEEASVLFRTYGIKSVTMDLLAAHMGISKRTIYEVFRDKDELLTGVLKWMTVRQREIMEKTLNESENVIEAIFKMMKTMMEHFKNMSPAFQMDIKRYHQDIAEKLNNLDQLPYVKNNELIIERGIKEGSFRKDLDVKIINKCMLEVLKMSSDREIFPPDAFGSEEVVRNVYLNYLRGLCTPKGLELIDHYDKKNK